MENNASLFVTHDDYTKLIHLLPSADPELADLLEAELNRATLVSIENLPQDTVSMNTTVSFVDLDSGKNSTMTLVYPHDSNLNEKKISVLAPIGAALIGLRVNQTIEWPLPGGRIKRLQIVSVSR